MDRGYETQNHRVPLVSVLHTHIGALYQAMDKLRRKSAWRAPTTPPSGDQCLSLKHQCAMIPPKDNSMTEPSDATFQTSPKLPLPLRGFKRVEHYALSILNSMAAGTNSGLSDGDIDFAIDVAERLAKKLTERGHIRENE